MRNRRIITSESVSEGHPDKICDRLSDAVLDKYLSVDSGSRVACEALATRNFVLLAGEVRSKRRVTDSQLEELARETIRDIGYEQEGFHWERFSFQNLLHRQSADIAMGVDRDGAGDQGIMFGYACDETPEYMPAPLIYARRIVEMLSAGRRSGSLEGLGADAKSQVSLLYSGDHPVGVHSIVVSTQHEERLGLSEVRDLVKPVLERCFPPDWLSEGPRILINPTGRFVIGGPEADTGLTGRKIIVDSYGGAAPHGGGAFSGKDPSKVDRSGAYICRYMAKNIVAAGLAGRCVIQISYAIGVSEPQSLWVRLHEGRIDPEKLEKALLEMIDLRPAGICKRLGLARPVYERTAMRGHFGYAAEKDGGFSWESTDLVESLRSLV